MSRVSGVKALTTDVALCTWIRLDAIRVMLTVFVRKEKFCEGIQLNLLREGRVQALLVRLQEWTTQNTP